MKKMNAVKTPRPQSKYWKIDGIDGLECFQTSGIQHQYSRHSHRSYAIGIIESGIGVNEYDLGEYIFPPGEIVVMNPEVVHTGSSLHNVPLSYRMFYIDRSVFSRVMPDHRRKPYFPDVRIRHSEWALILLNLHKLLEGGEYNRLESQTLFETTISDFTEQISSPGIDYQLGFESKAVKKIKAYIQENYKEDISIEDLVQVSHLNRHYLIRIFKKSVGIPPHTYLNQIRIEHARELLKSGMPAADVAVDLSFSDQSHLTRHFKRITGITPKKYAKGHYRTII